MMNAVIIQDTVLVVNIGTTGLKGLDGIGSQTSYVHQQTRPADVWIINHNLGFFPSIELFTDGGQEFVGDSVNVTINQTQVILSAPYTGYARLT